MARVHGRVLATPIILILFLSLRPVCGGFVFLFISASRALVPSDFGLCGSYRILGLGSSGHRQEHDVPMGIGHSAAAPPAGMNCSAASSSSSSTVATSPFIAGSSADVGSSLVATSPSLLATSPSLAGPPPPLPPPPQAPPQSAKPLASVFGGQSFVLWLTGGSLGGGDREPHRVPSGRGGVARSPQGPRASNPAVRSVQEESRLQGQLQACGGHSILGLAGSRRQGLKVRAQGLVCSTSHVP